MSQRSSFVSEYIYCDACFRIAYQLLQQEDDLTIARFTPPIIAGKVHGSGKGDELLLFEFTIPQRLRKWPRKMCHDLSIAVLAEGCTPTVFRYVPGESEPIMLEAK